MLEEMEARAGGHVPLGAELQETLQAEGPDLLDLLRTRLLPALAVKLFSLCLEPLTVQELAWATGCEDDTGKVQQLVELLADLFSCCAGRLDQQERVAPHHKSVLAWLTSAAGMSAAQSHVSIQHRHRLLASSCLQQAMQCVADGQADSPLACTRQGAGLGYSLRHAVAHACLSGEGEVLQTLLLELGFRQAVCTTVSDELGLSGCNNKTISPDGNTLASGSQSTIIRETLARTCFGLFEAGLLHAPSFRLQLNRQCCDQLLSPRVIAGLRARTCKLAITIEQPRVQGSRLLAEVLGKLGICTAVEACKLSSLQGPSLAPRTPLDCSPSLAQCLVDSFPSLTSLALHGYSIPCSGLATLLAHPQLSLQLQQLDLTGTTILQQLEGVAWGLDTFIAALAPLTQLQVLTMPGCRNLGGLPGLLQALPQLHTLQLPDAAPEGQMQLDALLAATQLTSIKLNSLEGLTSSCADVPCSWQRLELTGCVDCATAAYLPLHSLTQPLVVGSLEITADYRSSGGSPLVAAAAHNLTQACQVPVRIKVWRLYMCAMPNIPAFLARQRVQMQQLVVLLQPLRHCTPEQVSIYHLIDVSAADVPALALLCQGCTHLEFLCGSLVPSLEFWGQLVQLMPTVTFVVFKHVEGSTSSAMRDSLELMTEQPWARWLDICISRPSGSSELPACWLADNPSKPGKLRVWFKA
ncbi:hypothetical protein QJQ45_010519 [Haematococcus lacustris]|nr:hypothetical protein QJQ45_010519 [Haematococcus lacustris]